MPKLKTAIAIKNPEIPFEDTQISLSASGVEINGQMDLSVNLTLTPYRALPGGIIEYAHGSVIRYAEGQSKNAAKAFQDLAADIESAISKFMKTKGH
jgi:hypothetical protein